MADGCPGQKINRGVVDHPKAAVLALNDSAVAVRSVFAQTNIGDDHEIGHCSLDGADGLLGDSLLRVSF
jgi:hypothetical protein